MIEGIFLLLGSNLGDKKKLIQSAREYINERIGSIVNFSSIYETAAWGNQDQPSFYNQVVELKSKHSPRMVLKKINAIEQDLGRIRKEKWGARNIDIDILYYGQETINTTELTVPHPGIPERRFTLVPLVEIAPKFIHPVLKKNNISLLENCSDPLEVKIVNE